MPNLCSDNFAALITPYQMFQVTKNHGDEEIVHVQEWLETNFDKSITLDTMMQAGNLSKKTLARRFKKVTGDTPMAYLQKIRIENAKRLLESKKIPSNEVTWKVATMT
jgi:transcriptional regulator GlxA family with amidase domain